MPYQLRENLSFCDVDGHLFFLDTGSDRYFMLPEALEREFSLFATTGDPVHARGLTKLGILTACSTEGSPVAPCAHVSCARSALEEENGMYPGPLAILEVMTLIWRTKRSLAKKPLKRVIEEVASHRKNLAGQADGDSLPSSSSELATSARAFMAARMLSPIPTNCLLDSLAMVTFLARRKFAASLVFGISGTPFSAHCWVHTGDMVVNDTVGYATAHTPIRIV